jgi:hypothetical protein
MEGMTTHDDGLELTPQDWGLPENAGTQARACWYRQEAFLEAFRKSGRVGTCSPLKNA